MMGEEKSVLTKVGDAMGAAMDKAQEMGASLVRQTEVAASDAKRGAGKARTAVAKKARAAKANVKRKGKAAEADAKKAFGKAKRTVTRKAKAVEADAARVLGKAKRALKRKVKTAAAGAKKAAGKVERAMSSEETRGEAQDRRGQEGRGTQDHLRQVRGEEGRRQGQDDGAEGRCRGNQGCQGGRKEAPQKERRSGRRREEAGPEHAANGRGYYRERARARVRPRRCAFVRRRAFRARGQSASTVQVPRPLRTSSGASKIPAPAVCRRTRVSGPTGWLHEGTEAPQARGAKEGGKRHFRGIPTRSDPDQVRDRGQSGRVEQVPIITQECFHDRVKILRRILVLGVRGHEARRNVECAAQRDAHMGKIPAHSGAIGQNVARTGTQRR